MIYNYMYVCVYIDIYIYMHTHNINYNYKWAVFAYIIGKYLDVIFIYCYAVERFRL